MPRRDALRDGYLLAGAAWLLVLALGLVPIGVDGHAYWSLDLAHPYDATYGLLDGYNYSPAFAQVVAPFTVLPWPLFLAALSAVNLAALWYLVGRWAVLALLFPPVAIEMFAANVNLIIAAAVVAGFRYPAAWAFPILTKVAPGIGVLWFAVRREWRSLAIALGTTAAIVAVSVVLAPHLWAEWVTYLRGNAGMAPPPYALPVPFMWRLPVAVAVIVGAALTDRRWLLPVGLILATPVIWPATFSLLLASWRLAQSSEK